MRAVDFMVFMMFFLAFSAVVSSIAGQSVVENSQYSPIQQTGGTWSSRNIFAVLSPVPFLGVSVDSPEDLITSLVFFIASLASVGYVVNWLTRGFAGGEGRFTPQVIGVVLFGWFFFTYSYKVSIILNDLPFLREAGLGFVPPLMMVFCSVVGILGMIQLLTGVSTKWTE